jgi:DHA2 family multidrug resistance protein
MTIASIVGLGLFIHRELTTEHPAVDLRILRYPSMIGGSIYSAVLGMGLYGIMFAVPVFLQDFLHYTALQTGMILMPGAIASAAAMILYGKIAHQLPPRLLICIGALLMAATGLMLMTLNPNTGAEQIFWPLILRGVGSVLMFMPLSIATLGPLPKEDIAAGSGFYSLTRQLGSSIGIALITTIVVRRVALHRAVLVEKVSLFREPVLERFNSFAAGLTNHTGDPVAGQHSALGILDRIVNGQSGLLAYDDMFFGVAVLFVISLPLVLLLGDKKKPAAGKKPSDQNDCDDIEDFEAEAAVH